MTVDTLPESGIGGTSKVKGPSRLNAGRLVFRRLVLAPVTLLGVTFAVFVMVDLSPNDPALARLGMFASAEAREQFAEENGLNDPLVVRFVRFLGDLVQFDFGDSVVRPETVGELISRALPVSFQLMAFSIALACLFGLVLGVLAAWKEGRATDRAISGLVAMLYAAPDFWLGLLFIQTFAVALGILPSGGYVPISEGFGPWLSPIIGPAVVLALGIMAALTRIVRASMADELAKDYVITARGSGLSWPVVLFRNVLRNALITPITVLGVVIGSLMSGAVLVETIFNLPGMGTLLITGVNQGDLGVVRAVAIVAAAVFVVVNLVVDLLHVALSPRSVEMSAQ
ncbi:ABC transporter permease [Jiangella asiatica]|uniref:ABC transporter permease n=1 Tax=Jiangella asiatica TaxID=2530372 RepID=A0A4R5DAF5_9ACTN|nr:ABC transporter permease [Jiangella asiatica]TDE10606.1 ABC transporter permease [Jiangella asiatica]